MRTYIVELRGTVEVEAENEDEALSKAAFDFDESCVEYSRIIDVDDLPG